MKDATSHWSPVYIILSDRTYHHPKKGKYSSGFVGEEKQKRTVCSSQLLPWRCGENPVKTKTGVEEFSLFTKTFPGYRNISRYEGWIPSQSG